ncbi:hypothetical protein GCM10022384_40550 [Streptomyces marokkonensis]|uniref:Secreted protein n=1 Tax=Streptomyces marokkonensis TaxID=324855 RepID=A0ABP7QVT9_9ACTN
MRRAPLAFLALSLTALLAGCTQAEPVSDGPTRSPAEAAWHESSTEERQAHCAAYDAHDPQQPVEIPAHQSDQTSEEFSDDFYEVLVDQC